MFKRLLPLLVFILSGQFILSQNLVPNGDFEGYTSLPNSSGEWYRCIGWSNVNGVQPTVWPNPTTDYYNSMASGAFGLPNALFLTVYPYSGNGVMGIVVRGNEPEYREYISSRLYLPLEIGKTYNVSFAITSGIPNPEYLGCSSNHIGLRFSNSALTQSEHEPIGGIPQFEILGEFWDTSWQVFTFNFTADSAYEFITFGNFYSDSVTSYTQRVIGSLDGAYNVFDKIEIVPTGLFIWGDVNVCRGHTVILRAYNGSSYAWANSLSPNSIISTDSMIAVEATENSIYYVYSNGDTASFTITVEDPLPSSIFGNDTTVCNGLNITLDATTPGATSYVWTSEGYLSAPTFITPHPDYYVVDVGNSCGTVTDGIEVDIVSYNQTVNLGPDATYCDEDTITLDATLQQYNTYLWQDGSTNFTFTVTQSGTYWARETNVCGSRSDTIHLVFANTPVIELGANISLCQDSVVLYGGSASSYLWSTGSTDSSITVSTTGTYTLQASNSNCSDVDAVQVIVHPAPSAQIIQNGNEITGNGNGSFQWYFNGEVIPSQTDTTYTITQSGSYYVVATTSTDCYVQSNTLELTYIGIEEALLSGFRTYPNPVGQMLYIENTKSEPKTVSLYDVLGRKMLEEIFEGGQTHTIDFSKFSKGIYVICFQLKGVAIRKRLVKE